MRVQPKEVIICNALDLKRYRKTRIDFVVSILDPGSEEPEVLRTFSNHRRCNLRFHDIVEETNGLVAPQADHIEELLEFGRAQDRESDNRMLIHCFAGLCRSTAAGLLLMAQNDAKKSPDDAIARLLRIAPNAWPNTRMIRLGDKILQYNGRLLSAMELHYNNMCKRYPMFGELMRHGGKL